MPLLAADPTPLFTPPVALAVAVAFAVLGFAGLLPQPRGRMVLLGGLFSAAALGATAIFVLIAFPESTADLVGQILFWLFGGGALVFGTVLVAQRNPARGAIAFAFVVLSTCGLFLLLAAPFLMAATVIIYAGAIIVTFLFVLMLSHAGGPSDENDRSRDPLLGSLAGFGCAGLVLFALYQTAAMPAGRVLVPPLSEHDRDNLRAAAGALQQAGEAENRDKLLTFLEISRGRLSEATRSASTKPLQRTAKQAFDAAENRAVAGDLAGAKAALAGLHDEVVVLSGRGQLPARNVGNIGLLLYSEHLLAVEMAGTLLLVATIGAVAIAGRKGVAA